MNQDSNEISTNRDCQAELIHSSIEQLQQDLFLAKCEIKTSVRDVAISLNFLNDLFLKLRADFSEINERLHGIELRQRQNSST